MKKRRKRLTSDGVPGMTRGGVRGGTTVFKVGNSDYEVTLAVGVVSRCSVSSTRPAMWAIRVAGDAGASGWPRYQAGAQKSPRMVTETPVVAGVSKHRSAGFRAPVEREGGTETIDEHETSIPARMRAPESRYAEIATKTWQAALKPRRAVARGQAGAVEMVTAEERLGTREDDGKYAQLPGRSAASLSLRFAREYVIAAVGGFKQVVSASA
ncbi:hypothetical protein DFH09DRAFT_1116145 [Mycena vulgaris]|nr:hypothetical protein DFH09DRAFT_1116145 [Mycena vulgaris]